jgi:anaerobic ribonucleoside-triphosphate reductase activating protein
MLKYLNTQVTFAEVPDEITLCINITGCKNGCKNCHSSYLAEDIGNPLNKTVLSKLLEDNKGISCVSFMGGDRDTIHIVALASWVKTHTNLKVAWYSGRQEISDIVARQLRWFDYIKLGPYKEEFGPLNSRTTNQRFYKVSDGELVNITSRFYDRNLETCSGI